MLTILDSLQFAAGFFGVQSYQTSYHQVIEIEEPGFNSTLAPYDNCENSNNAVEEFGFVQAGKWGAIYTVPATKRLSKYLKGVNLTSTDILAMQSLCAYEVRTSGFSCALTILTNYSSRNRRSHSGTPLSAISSQRMNGRAMSITTVRPPSPSIVSFNH